MAAAAGTNRCRYSSSRRSAAAAAFCRLEVGAKDFDLARVVSRQQVLPDRHRYGRVCICLIVRSNGRRKERDRHHCSVRAKLLVLVVAIPAPPFLERAGAAGGLLRLCRPRVKLMVFLTAHNRLAVGAERCFDLGRRVGHPAVLALQRVIFQVVQPHPRIVGGDQDLVRRRAGAGLYPANLLALFVLPASGPGVDLGVVLEPLFRVKEDAPPIVPVIMMSHRNARKSA